MSKITSEDKVGPFYRDTVYISVMYRTEFNSQNYQYQTSATPWLSQKCWQDWAREFRLQHSSARTFLDSSCLLFYVSIITYFPWWIAVNSAQMEVKSGRTAGSWCQHLMISCSSWFVVVSDPSSHFTNGRKGIASVRHTRAIISAAKYTISEWNSLKQNRSM